MKDNLPLVCLLVLLPGTFAQMNLTERQQQIIAAANPELTPAIQRCQG